MDAIGQTFRDSLDVVQELTIGAMERDYRTVEETVDELQLRKE